MERIIIYWKQKSQERRSWCIKINVYDKKTELRDGVVKTIESKGKLAYIAFEYEETIETEKNKVDSDLEHLILINSIWKEKRLEIWKENLLIMKMRSTHELDKLNKHKTILVNFANRFQKLNKRFTKH